MSDDLWPVSRGSSSSSVSVASQPHPCATMGLSNHRDPVGPHFSEPVLWGAKVDWCVLDSNPSLRNHPALSCCVPCLMYKWAAHQRSMGAQLIMKLRLYPGCTPLCPIFNHSLTLSPHSVSMQV